MELRTGYIETDVGLIPENWELLPFEAVLRKIGAKQYQIQTLEYLDFGTFPVVDQGQRPVVAFSERSDKVYKTPENGVIVFGDHTCIFKYVDFDFIVGADGTQVLATTGNHSSRFHAFALEHRGVESTGYNRHFKFLKERLFVGPPPEEQRAIAAALSDVNGLIASLEALMAKKRDLKQAVMQQLLTGKKRLPGFIGEWEVKRLGEIGKFLKGSGVRRDEAQTGNLPCVRYGEIYTFHQNVIRTFSSHISPSVAEAATRIQFGDLLFAASGETKEEIGKCVALANDVEAYAGGDIVILRASAGNPVFLGYLMNTPGVVRQKANRGQGDAVVHISAAALASIEIVLPDEPEQEAVAAVLTDMETELATLEARHDKARALKQGMMQELLTGRTRLV